MTSPLVRFRLWRVSRPRNWRGRLRHVRTGQVMTDRWISEIRKDAGLPPVTTSTSAADAILPLFDAVDLPHPPLDKPFKSDWLNQVIDRINRPQRAA